MDDPLSRGLPFELADIWRRSALQAKDGDDDSLFAPLEASFPSLSLGPLSEENVLSIPPLETPDDISGAQNLEPVDSDIASPPFELWDTGQQPPDDPPSVWDLDLNLDLPPERPRIDTWEAFEKKSVPDAERSAYLSEAGPAAFDAVLAGRNGKSNGVLPQDVMLRALCNLALGRASVFFQWDETKAAFTRTLDDVPISGYSSAACDSLITQILDYATLYRSLRASCTGARAQRRLQPCKVAFRGCLSDVLDAIEEQITKKLSRVQSILQLQALVDPLSALLSTIDILAVAVGAAQTDEAIVSTLSDQVHEIVSADSSFGHVLRVILQRTSTPWLEQLAADFGLIEDKPGLISARSDEEAEFQESQNSAALASSQREELAHFMSVEDRKMLRDAKNGLKILRKTLPQQVVHDKAQELFRSACGRQYEQPDGVSTISRPNQPFDAETVQVALDFEGFAWNDLAIQQRALARIDAQMSGPPSPPESADDGVRIAVLSYCDLVDSAIDRSSSLVTDVSPLDRIRPALVLQSEHLNRTVMRHLFINQLTHHLRLQHAYHLLHSGEFVTRLSTALFSAETQSAERKRGTVPTGQTMGLRLGARNEQRWPPASSELRLTLMDVLTESYKADFSASSESPPSGSSKELPGGLSFSIRELPEHEIERVMDPSSIYALDFLRLQYTAPAPLDAILTPASMQVYDSIFRQLLRILRAVHVTTALSRTLSHRSQITETGSPAGGQDWRVRFAQRAQTCMTTLFSYMMDLGVGSPWRALATHLAAAEGSLENDDSKALALGIESLKQIHTTYLDRIRDRLFLRRKQEKLRCAIEELLSAVLSGASLLETHDEAGGEHLTTGLHKLDHATNELLKLLRVAVDKPPKARRATTTPSPMNGATKNDEDDIEVMRILLMRLESNSGNSP